MQEFFSKYFISCIDTGPSMLSNGSNSIILPIVILSIFTESSSNTVKETLFLGIFFIETQQHFLCNSLGNKVDRQPP